MFGDKIKLTPEEILNKNFYIDTRGYRPQEVDAFLDMVISDYQEFLSIVKRYDTEYRNIITENSRLKSEIRDLKSKLDLATENKEVTSIDIIKRISELEKTVYGDNE